MGNVSGLPGVETDGVLSGYKRKKILNNRPRKRCLPDQWNFLKTLKFYFFFFIVLVVVGSQDLQPGRRMQWLKWGSRILNLELFVHDLLFVH